MRCNYCGLLTFHNSVVLHYAYMQNRASENQALFRLRAHTYIQRHGAWQYVLVKHIQNNRDEKAVCLLSVFLYGYQLVYGTLSSWNRKCILASILLKMFV